jgi:hypothetical protein
MLILSFPFSFIAVFIVGRIMDILGGSVGLGGVVWTIMFWTPLFLAGYFQWFILLPNLLFKMKPLHRYIKE